MPQPQATIEEMFLHVSHLMYDIEKVGWDIDRSVTFY